LEARVGKLHLRLDARRTGDATAARSLDEELHQRRLADAGCPPQYQYLALATQHGRDKAGQRVAFTLSSA
jgi:hypothetical protein